MSVPAVGPTPSPVLLVGKAPGREEIAINRPHVGRAGRELKFYCGLHNLPIYSSRLTNLCRDFVPPDVRLTPAQVAAWEPDILSEIAHTKPRIIIALGADPIRFFLGASATLSLVHGIPCRPGQFDSSIAYRSLDCPCILPVYQPAAGFHSSDARALINWDFAQVARILKLVHSSREHEIDYRDDPYTSAYPSYLDVTGREMREILFRDGFPPPLIALDTEGTRSDPFSLQATTAPGEGYLLRIDQLDFATGIQGLQECANAGSVITGHNIGMYDLPILSDMGLDLFHAHVHDTLFDAYLFGLEPLGLKANGFRQCGIRMKSHAETVGYLSRELQIDYLERVLGLCRDWPKPDPVLKVGNDGVVTIKQPNTLSSRLRKIIHDIETDSETDEDTAQEPDAPDRTGRNDTKEDKYQDSEDVTESMPQGVDPFKRWRAVKKDIPEQTKRVEHELGRMPSGTMRLLYERDPEAAINYSAMDSDVSHRLYPIFFDRLRREDKLPLAEVYSRNMHVFSEMQENGMPARRSRLAALRSRMTEAMLTIGAEISNTYNDGKPFNPRSRPQTAVLFERYGLEGTKKTKGGAISYGKKSIEHLKFIDDKMSDDEKFCRELVGMLFKWREHQHTRDMFCAPILDMLPEDVDECTVRGQILPWGTHTRRNAMKRPNLLAQPKHSVYGRWVRDCYEAAEGEVFIESDLGSIEVCIMADESRDPDLIRILNSDVKFHKVTRQRVFGTPLDTPTDQDSDKGQYTVSKRIIFGTFFGQTGTGLREQLMMQNITQYDEDRCQEFIDEVKYRVYPGIGLYEEKIGRQLRYGTNGSPGHPSPDAGRIADLSGHERHLPGIWSEDRGVAQEAVRHAVSQKIQGGAQTLIQNAIAWLKDEVRRLRVEEGIDVRWRLTVHDSLLLTAPEWAASMVIELVEEGLTKHCGVKLRVPVRAESKTARTWGGL